jgi:RNA polymerase sigma-B factor
MIPATSSPPAATGEVARAAAVTLVTSRPTAGVLPSSSGTGPRVASPAPAAQSRMRREPDTAVAVDGLTDPDALLARLGRLAPGDAGWVALRAEVIEWFLPLAVQLARRFSGRGEPLADLTQVAVIGLIRAIDRFDPDRGVPFVCYATPTIVGSIKRHFRDSTWGVRVPRQMQELIPQVGAATEELAQALQRSPTTVELAARLNVTVEVVAAARLGANAYRPIAFDRPLGWDGSGLIDVVGDLDPRIDAADSHEALRQGLATLPVRDQRIIELRFFADMTQTQIGVELGISQMHVSRLLTKALAHLRAAMLTDDTDRASQPRRELAPTPASGSQRRA